MFRASNILSRKFKNALKRRLFFDEFPKPNNATFFLLLLLFFFRFVREKQKIILMNATPLVTTYRSDYNIKTTVKNTLNRHVNERLFSALAMYSKFVLYRVRLLIVSHHYCSDTSIGCLEKNFNYYLAYVLRCPHINISGVFQKFFCFLNSSLTWLTHCGKFIIIKIILIINVVTIEIVKFYAAVSGTFDVTTRTSRKRKRDAEKIYV